MKLRAITGVLRLLDPRDYFGPIFFKEMLITGRRSFSHWMRLFTGLLLAFILWIVVSESIHYYGYNSSASRIRDYQQIAPTITLAIGWILAGVLPVVAAAFGSGAMLDERKARTMESILATPMDAWTIVASKVSSRLIQLIILTLMALPVLLAARTFGGIGVGTILAFTAVALSQAIFATTLATYNSLKARKAWSALVSAIAGVMALNILPFLVFLIASLSTPMSLRSPQWVEGILLVAFHISPFAALGVETAGGVPPMLMQSLPFPGSQWISASIVCLVLSLLTMLATAKRLRAESVGKRRTKVKRRKDGAVKSSRKKPRARSRTVAGNPVAWREMRQPMMRGPKKLKIVSAVLFVGVLGFLYIRVDPQEVGLHYILLMLAFFFSVLFSINATTGAITGEREARSLDVLLSTPMSAWGIMLGKWLGAFPMPLLVLQFITLHSIIYILVGLAIGEETLTAFLPVHGLMLGIGTISVLTSTGLVFAVLCKKSSVAMVANIALWLGLWIGVPVMLGVLSLDSWDYPLLWEFIGFMDPFVLFAETLDGGVAQYSWGSGHSSVITYEYGDIAFNKTVGLAEWTSYLVIWAVGTLALSALLTWISSRILAKKTIRKA